MTRFEIPLRLIVLAVFATGIVTGNLLRAEEMEPATASRLVPALPLSLEECRRLALTHNLALRAQREALAAAGFLRKAEWGAFEPEFVASRSEEFNRRENTVEQTISQGTTAFQERNKLYSAGVEGLLPTGARYNVGYSVRDLNNNLRVLPTDPFRRQYQSFLGLTLTQPLLKDAGFASSLARLRLAREDENIARQDFRRQMMLVVGSVESIYWDLYVAQQRYELRQASVAAAQKLLDENRERVREGKMAQIELVEAEAGLAQRRSSASAAEQQLVEISGQLRTLFAEPVDEPNFVLTASDTPQPIEEATNIGDALGASVALHPEYLSRLHRAEQEKVRIAYAKNQRWPQVDLKASFGNNGLGDDYNSSWSDVKGQRYDSWSLGIELRVPVLLGIRQTNTVRAARARGREALLNLKAAEVEIANNIFTALRKVESFKAVAANYDEVAGAGQRLLTNELDRLVEGKTDSRRLLEVENQFSDAKIAALETRGEYEKARVEFEMACGRLLEARGVDLTDGKEKNVSYGQSAAVAQIASGPTEPSDAH
jgi:outer membrane protein TolC